MQHNPPKHGLPERVWAFLRVRKRFWLAPLLLALGLVALLIVLASNQEVTAPFVYQR
ncbi:MAG: hypothetical protein HYV27_08720 [Candidatus Hydrogenedentes bacterium]|nr:hypothetical protein [Candidatus Hydrogenedentota bacterium]